MKTVAQFNRSKMTYMVKCSHGFYLTYSNDYSGRGWGWTDDQDDAAKFTLPNAARVLELSMAESSRWENDYPVVVDENGVFIPTTAKEKAYAKKPQPADLDW